MSLSTSVAVCNSRTVSWFVALVHVRPCTLIRLLVAAVLIFSAALKAYAISNANRDWYSSLHIPIWVIMQILIVEFLIGIWIVAGIHKHAAWFCSVLFLAAFCFIAAMLGFLGVSTCPCFGFLAISPWLTASMDLSLLAALLLFPPMSTLHQTTRFAKASRLASIPLAFVMVSIVFGTGFNSQLKARPNKWDSTALDDGDRSAIFHSAILLSTVGFTQEKGASNESVEQLLNSEVVTNWLEKYMLTVQPPSSALQAIEKDNPFSIPSVFEDTKARQFLLMGSVNDYRGEFFQLLYGDAPPFLVARSQIQSVGIREAWRAKRSDTAGIEFNWGGAKMNIDTLYHNFGVVQPYKTVQTTFHLKNVGHTEIRIVGEPESSCGCVVTDVPDTTLNPGTMLPLTVRAHTGDTDFRHSVRVKFAKNGSNELFTLTTEVFGSQFKSMAITPRRLDFGIIGSEEPIRRTLRLSETTYDRFKIVSVSVGELPLTWSLCQRTKENGLKDYQIVFVLTPNRAMANDAASKNDLTIATDSPLVPKLRIPIHFEDARGTNVRRSTILAMGKITAGDLVERLLKLRSPDIHADQQIRITGSPSDLHTEIANVGDGWCEVKVRLIASEYGPFNDALQCYFRKWGVPLTLSFQHSQVTSKR